MGSQMSMINLRMSGTNAGGEEWTTGVWLGTLTPVAFSEAGLVNYEALVEPHCTTLWNALRTYASTGTAWQSVSLYAYIGGSDTAAAVYHKEFTPIAGSAASGQHPDQVCLVCSLRSSSPTRQGRGRMYLPLTALPLTAGTSQVTSAATGAIAGAMQTFLNSLAGTEYDEQATLHPIVYSRSQSLARDIVSVVVNSVPDIQRRRANQLVPLSTVTLPTA